MLLDEVGAYLQTQSVGTLGSTIFLGQLPDDPDTALSLFEYGGLSPLEVYAHPEQKHERPRLQVIVRAKGYATARALIESAYRALDFANQTLSGVFYLRSRPLQPPFFLKRDENERWHLVFNVQIEKLLS